MFDLSETAAHLAHDLAREEGTTPSALVERLIRNHAVKVFSRKDADEDGEGDK